MRACRAEPLRSVSVTTVLVVVCVAASLPGCGASLEPITTASVSSRPAAVASARQPDCAVEVTAAKPTTVDAMLTAARSSQPSTAPAASSQDCVNARIRAQLASVAAGPVDAPSAAVAVAGRELTIEFDGDDARLTDKDKAAVASLVAANRKAGSKVVRLQAGRGGGGNIFEQAVLAERRARLVKRLLPPDLSVSVEFDPAQADDTVRVEFSKS